MKYRGFHIIPAKGFRPIFGILLRSNLPLRAGISTVLVVSSGLTILPGVVNADSIRQAGIAPTLTAQTPAAATVIYVNSATGSDTAAGTTQAAALKTITFALTKAQAGTVIQLAPGTYNQQSGETFPLILKPGVTIRGDEATKGQGILIKGGGYYTSKTFARQDITILGR